MKVEILDRTKKKKIMEKISETYGVDEINGLFIKTGKEKIRMFTGEIGWDELNEFAKNIHIEIIGVQLCTVEEDGIRINFDAINIPEIKNKIIKDGKSVFEISEEQINEWLNGKSLDFEPFEKVPKPRKTFEGPVGKTFEGNYIVVKNNNDLFGIGKIRESGNSLSLKSDNPTALSNRKTYVQNYVPKERRVRS